MKQRVSSHPLTLAGIANESGGITLIPLQVSVSGQGGATLHTLPAQTLTGTIAVQSAVTKPATKPISPLRKGSLSLFFRKVRILLSTLRLRSNHPEVSCEADTFHLSTLAAVPHGQRAPQRSVCQTGHFCRVEEEDLDVF